MSFFYHYFEGKMDIVEIDECHLSFNVKNLEAASQRFHLFLRTASIDQMLINPFKFVLLNLFSFHLFNFAQ